VQMYIFIEILIWSTRNVVYYKTHSYGLSAPSHRAALISNHS
jgi:hypothetical protein